jgi:PPM family protein phosphatase
MVEVLTANCWQSWNCPDGVQVWNVPGGEIALLSVGAPGCGPRQNEDAAAVVFESTGRGLLIVSDGVGGARQGRQAAHRAVSALCDAVRGADGIQRSSVISGIEQAQNDVLSLRGAACTLTVVELGLKSFRPYQIGDSMTLVVGGKGKLKFQSLAHGPTGYALAAGYLNEHEALEHPALNVVYNVLGIEEMFIDLGSALNLAPRDTVLVASDGLFDNLYHQEIVSQICQGSLQHVAQKLYELSLERMLNSTNGTPSKPDDLTFVMYRQQRAKTKHS